MIDPALFIQYQKDGFKLKFLTTYGVFSPKTIDKGTALLLSYLDCFDGARVLDLGCGYGVIGLVVAKKYPNCKVELVDKDFVAIECANENIKINHLSNARAYLSNGLAHTNGEFDRIYCNLPAKIGNELTGIFLKNCYEKLANGGSLQWVCINSLRHHIKRVSSEIFTHYRKIKQSNQYTVFEIQK